jgi:hypothetical protein
MNILIFSYMDEGKEWMGVTIDKFWENTQLTTL